MSDSSCANQLELEIVFEDEHLIEVRARVTCRGWTGNATAYAGHADLEDFAGRLRQFSATLQGSAALELGKKNGIGFIGLNFYEIDTAGHVVCAISLATQTATDSRAEEMWRLALEMQTEPGLIDAFADQLERLGKTRSGKAVLCGVT